MKSLAKDKRSAYKRWRELVQNSRDHFAEEARRHSMAYVRKRLANGRFGLVLRANVDEVPSEVLAPASVQPSKLSQKELARLGAQYLASGRTMEIVEASVSAALPVKVQRRIMSMKGLDRQNAARVLRKARSKAIFCYQWPLVFVLCFYLFLM